MSIRFADIIIPLAVEGSFTYRIPEEMQGRLSPGMIVIVQFGKQKYYSGVIRKIHSFGNAGGRIKDISLLQEDTPVVSDFQLRLWQWIAGYYMCTLGEVCSAALPSGFRLESETRFVAGDLCPCTGEVNDRQLKILDAVADGNNTFRKLRKLFPESDLVLNIRSLSTRGFLKKEEKISGKSRPATVTNVKLIQSTADKDGITSLLSAMKNSKGKAGIISAYLDIISTKTGDEGVERSLLLKTSGVSPSVLREMIRQGLFKTLQVEAVKSPGLALLVEEPVKLTAKQESALVSVKKHFELREVVLLHGVTSAGKTEIYMHLIQETLEQGRQVLYLMPEIALTTQMVMRLRIVFGDKVAVYHSRYSDTERIRLWRELVNSSGCEKGKTKIILGARSAVFLPFSNLGLIIVDEEHESSYKQFDPAPRYNARDTAIILAGYHGAKVLLGTATPSVETYYNCGAGKYGMVELNERYRDIKLPEILVVNTREARRKKAMHSHFSDVLVQSISGALENNEQVILFQNRRGYSRYLECRNCGYIPACKKCNVTLTHHRSGKGMQCHYCGYSAAVPAVCPVCGIEGLVMKGFGTEQIEDEIPTMFPGAKTVRLDYDTARKRESYEAILESFSRKESDILIGTQMVSKGLHFDHVKVVGVMSADALLNFPDFRSYERSFQQLAQVSGRAGRKNSRGRVIIQTGDDKHPVLQYVINNDYKAFYSYQIEERRLFNYPPFSRLIRITLKHRDSELLDQAAGKLARILRDFLGERLIGPEYPIIDRIRGFYLKDILIKAARDSSLQEIKSKVKDETFGLLKIPAFRSVQAVIDVDPG